MIYLIDKKLMPGNGIFRFKVLDPTEFQNLIRDALELERLDNRIMDPDTVDILKEVTQSEIPLCPLSKGEGEIILETGDAVLSAQVMSVEPLIKEVAPQANQQVKVSINVIMATHYDFTPEGLVACVKDTQLVSGVPKIEWYTEFRDKLKAHIPLQGNENEEKPQAEIVQIL